MSKRSPKSVSEKLEASISHLCHLLNVSRSGYYKWLQHQETTSE